MILVRIVEETFPPNPRLSFSVYMGETHIWRFVHKALAEIMAANLRTAIDPPPKPEISC